MSKRQSQPIKVNIGWLDTNQKRDAVEFAKGYAARHMDAPEISFFATMGFLGGFFWEVQEGGLGRSFLPAVAEALAKGVEPAWFRVGTRAYSVALRDQRPYCILQPVAESQALFASGVPELAPKGKMTPVVQKGKTTFAIGIGLFATGFLFMGANLGGYALVQSEIPEVRKVDAETLPHRQWSRVERTALGSYVDTMKFEKGTWSTSLKPVVRSADSGRTTPANSRSTQVSMPSVTSPSGQGIPPNRSVAPPIPVSSGGASAPAASRPAQAIPQPPVSPQAQPQPSAGAPVPSGAATTAPAPVVSPIPGPSPLVQPVHPVPGNPGQPTPSSTPSVAAPKLPVTSGGLPVQSPGAVTAPMPVPPAAHASPPVAAPSPLQPSASANKAPVASPATLERKP